MWLDLEMGICKAQGWKGLGLGRDGEDEGAWNTNCMDKDSRWETLPSFTLALQLATLHFITWKHLLHSTLEAIISNLSYTPITFIVISDHWIITFYLLNEMLLKPILEPIIVFTELLFCIWSNNIYYKNVNRTV